MSPDEMKQIKQKLGMTEDKTIKPQGKQAEIDLAGDSIWDREGENPAKVYVQSITIENPYEPGGYMDDDEDDGYRSVVVMHNGPWTIYTDSGFAEEISALVGFKVDFTEQGMQEDGRASMEGTTSDAMESVQEGRMGFSDLEKLGRENASKVDMEARRRGSADMEPGDADRLRYKIAKEMGLVESTITEGYEGKVLGILKKEGIGAYFSGGKLYIDQADMSEAKSVLSDNDEIKELPDMVAETLQDSDLSRVKKLAGI